MSLVGPRPPLPYEVAEYTEWQRQRLRAIPGVSGLWQVGGRSRVSFDEMVFQDVFYSANQSPLVDVLICLRTCRRGHQRPRGDVSARREHVSRSCRRLEDDAAIADK